MVSEDGKSMKRIFMMLLAVCMLPGAACAEAEYMSTEQVAARAQERLERIVKQMKDAQDVTRAEEIILKERICEEAA